MNAVVIVVVVCTFCLLGFPCKRSNLVFFYFPEAPGLRRGTKLISETENMPNLQYVKCSIRMSIIPCRLRFRPEPSGCR